MANDFDALDDALENDSSSSSSDSSDVPENPWMNVTPRVAIAGEIRRLDFTGRIDKEQNVQGARPSDGGGDVRLTISDPEVVGGTLFENTDRPTNDEDVGLARTGDASVLDHRLVGGDTLDDDGDDSIEWEFGPDGKEGIRVYGKKFASEEVDSLDEDEIDVFVKNRAGRLVAQSLDASGGISAFYTDDGEKTSGLIEYPPYYNTDGYNPNEDGYPRLARTPTLHPEIEGERIILYMTWGDEFEGNRAHHGYVLLDDADDLSECTRLDGDVYDDDPEAVEWAPYLVWHDPDGSSSSDDDSDDDDDFSFDAAAVGSDDGDDQSYDDLSTSQQAFADEAIGHVEESDDDTLDAVFDDFDATVDGVVDAGEIESISPTAMRAAIEGRLTA